MKQTILALSAAGLSLAAPFAQAQSQDNARVISSVPVIQQVAVPQQVCSTQPVAVEQPKSGAGALLGAVAGGAVGNQIGSGGGRAVATMAGVIGGAVLGNRIEGPAPTVVQNQTTCSTQTVYESRTVGYNVTYEYAGRQYQVQMPQDPGPFVRVQVSPVMPPPAAVPAPAYPARPISVAPSTTMVVTTSAPLYSQAHAPAYYSTYQAPSVWPAVAVGATLGYVAGGYGRIHYGHHGHHGHHWR
jgi:uncharacterized protein YcfJ